MILARGEVIIFQGTAYLSSGAGWIPGALFLSNRRVVFEAGAGGPSPSTAYFEGVETIWNVHAGRSTKLLRSTKEYLTIEGQRGRVVFEVARAQEWATAVAHAKASITPRAPAPPPSTPAPTAPGSPTSVVVNIPAPAAPQLMMHCRHCGNLYDATKGRCDKCGAPPT